MVAKIFYNKVVAKIFWIDSSKAMLPILFHFFSLLLHCPPRKEDWEYLHVQSFNYDIDFFRLNTLSINTLIDPCFCVFTNCLRVLYRTFWESSNPSDTDNWKKPHSRACAKRRPSYSSTSLKCFKSDLLPRRVRHAGLTFFVFRRYWQSREASSNEDRSVVEYRTKNRSDPVWTQLSIFSREFCGDKDNSVNISASERIFESN